MRSALSHDEAFDELSALAFDLLDASQRDAVLEHVEDCAVCRDELGALRATVAELAFAAPLAESARGSRARIRNRLAARAAADRETVPVSAPVENVLPITRQTSIPARRSPGGWRRAEWLALAASVLFVVSLGALALSYRDRDALRTSLAAGSAQSARARQTADSLVAVVATRDSLLAGLTGREVSVLTLTSSAAKEPFARMFWDRATNTWTLIAHNMPALRPGRTYQLWLVTLKGKISAGTFAPRNGEAVVRATYALGNDTLQAIAVTEEPEGGVPQPTGEIVVAATATK